MKSTIYCLLFLLVTMNPSSGLSEHFPTLGDGPVDNQFNTWMKRGKLFFRNNPLLRGGFYVYKPKFPFGKTLIIRKKKEGINQLLKREFSNPVYGEHFLEEQFPQFIVAVITEDGDELIDANAVSRSLRWATTEYNMSEEKAKQLSRKLRPYATTLHPTLTGNTWKLEFNVKTWLGAVEKWKLDGTVTPLQVKSFRRTELEPKGTFPKVETVG